MQTALSRVWTQIAVIIAQQVFTKIFLKYLAQLLLTIEFELIKKVKFLYTHLINWKDS